MKKIICFITFMTLLGATKINAQDTWAKEYPASEPSTRTFNRLAKIGPDQILMFGGMVDPYSVDPTFKNDTWIYTISTKTWTEMLPSTMPTGHILTPRGSVGLAYIGDDKVLLYGGAIWGDILDGTWIYDLSDNTWTEMATSSSPGLRSYHSMAYIGNNEVVLFGGVINSVDGNSTNDTWVYNYVTNTWTEKFPATVPGKRINHAMCNIGGDKAMMNDGVLYSSGFLYNETWIYDASDNNWELKSPVGGPGGSMRHGLASLGGDKALWFQGTSWIYDLSENTWVQSAATTYPFWGEPGLASAGTNKVLAFGGTPSPSETWLFTAAVADPSCGPHKVYVCHNGHTICVDKSAVPAHLAHGDYVGPCTTSLINQEDDDVVEAVKPEIKILSNSGNGNFTITAKLQDEDNSETIMRIINVNGQVIKQLNMKEQKVMNINIERSGVYFIQLISKKEVVTKKLIVVRQGFLNF